MAATSPPGTSKIERAEPDIGLSDRPNRARQHNVLIQLNKFVTREGHG
jgi:hypothetical protein